jgi:hypothetical protein
MTRRPTDEQRFLRATTEDELLTAVLEWASLRGWLCHHDRRSDLALQQGDAGFFDLVLCRSGETLFVELKAETGKLTTEQMAWVLAAAGQDPSTRQAGHPKVYVFRPSDLDRALEVLR